MGQRRDRRGIIPPDLCLPESKGPDADYVYRGHVLKGGLADVPLWPVVTALALGFIWAVNTLSPGTLCFITGYSFVDSVMLGVIISALYILHTLRTREHDRDVEEIMENCARDKEAAEAEAAGHHRTMSH